MENKPLDLQRLDKLKVFCVLSALKTIPVEEIKDSFALTLSITYTPAEAAMAVMRSLMLKDKKPEDYFLNWMQIAINVEDIINLPTPPTPSPAPQEILEAYGKEHPKKTVEQHLEESVLTVFNLVGTPAQKKIAEEVIEKFKLYTAKQKEKVVDNSSKLAI